MTVTRIATACLAAATLTACETKPTEWFRVEPLSVRQADLDGGDKEKQVARTQGAPASINLDVYGLEIAGAANKVRLADVTTPAQRDAWIAFLIERSNQQCDYHKAGIVATQSVVNGTMGATAGVLGGVGALVTGATAARIFSGSAGMVTGLRAQYNEVFYQNLISTAVVKKIDELRNEKRKIIVDQMGKPIADYNIPRALLDIGAYHDDCSFYVGLVALTDDKQKLKPLGENLQVQLENADATVKSIQADLRAAEDREAKATTEAQKAAARAEQDLHRRSLRNQEQIRNSLRAQLSIVGAAKPAAPNTGGTNAAGTSNSGTGSSGTTTGSNGTSSTPSATPRASVQTAPVTPPKTEN